MVDPHSSQYEHLKMIFPSIMQRVKVMTFIIAHSSNHQIEANETASRIQKLLFTQSICYQWNKSWHVAEAFGHVDNLLSNSGCPLWFQIPMICKILAFFKIYFANISSLCRPEKLWIVQVLRYDDRHCGTSSGSTQFSWSSSSC